jgi:hypothetical protein
MSLFEQGPMGYIKGKTGNFVVAKWKDQSVGRKAPTKSSKPATLKQMTQQSKFALVGGFFNRMSDVISIGYQSQSGSLTPVNRAVKDHIDKIVLGSYPNFTLDYPKIVISNPSNSAEIHTGWTTKAVAAEGYGVDITWSSYEYGMDTLSLPTDRLIAVFYIVEQNKFMIFKGVADRSALQVKLTLPFLLAGKTLHLYTFFTSEDRKLASDSEYLGIVKLIA